MAVLNDIRNIIKPLDINLDTFNKDMDNILENLIINNNTIYNSYIFNHIIYNKYDLKENIINCITIHLDRYIKNQRIHFRNLNKKNKLDIKDFNIFFDECYKLINKLNGMFQHIVKNSFNIKYKKWGDSILWNILIDIINNVMLQDVVFKYAIFNNIKNTPSTEKNTEMYRLFNYLSIFLDYHNINNIHINLFDEALVNTIEININNIIIDNNINNIYKFKKIYKYYMDIYVNYYYITKQYNLNKLKNYITDFIKNIFENNNINFIKNFISIYKKEFISLIKHININNILLSYPINDINSYISYYDVLLKISHGNSLNSIVIECIKENTPKYFKSFDDVLYLADLINTDIINKEANEFYYLLGSYCNKDEFVSAICQKYMERIIYSHINNSDETAHYGALLKYFMNDRPLTLKYETISTDYHNSTKLWNSMYENQNNFKLIITSLDVWKINHSIGYSNTIINTEEFTTILCNKMFQYNDMNSHLDIKKKLIMYPHLGCVEIEIYNKTLQVLPAHMICLELFVTFDTHLMYNLIFDKVKQSMSNYSDNFIKRIIDSLIGPVLIKTKDESLRVRTDLVDTNLIEIFYNMNIKNTIINKIKEDLCHSKNDIIMANINHYIKQFEKININVLYEIVSNSINIFHIDKDMFMKAIASLTKNDYATVVDNNIIKCVI
jgi:hypothetical protein